MFVKLKSKILFVLLLTLMTLQCIAQDTPENILQYYVATRLNQEQAIIDEEMFTALGAGDEGHNMNGPSVIRVPDWIAPEDRAAPEAQYYCYFANHSGQYIRMAWAADIEGPWHLYQVGSEVAIGDRGVLDHGGNTIFLGNDLSIDPNHLASPDAHVDHVNQRIILYFHSGSSSWHSGVEIDKQITWVATSPYGLEFYDSIEPVYLGGSYFAVFEYDGELYALDNGASINKALDAAAPWTPPADHNYTKALWDKDGNPFQDAITENTGLTSDILRVRHASVRVVGDELQVFYSRRGDFIESVQMSTVDLSAGDWTEWESSWPPLTLLQPIPGWEGGEMTPDYSKTASAPEDVNQLRDPYLFEDDDGSLYIFYAGRGEDAIGLASLTEVPEGVVTPPFKPWSLNVSAASSSQIVLDWVDNAFNEQAYIIERKTGDGSFEEIALAGVDAASYLDEDLSPASSYTYRVCAYNEAGKSPYTNEGTASTFTLYSRILKYPAKEDTYIRGGIHASTNFGTESQIDIKTGSNPDYFRKGLLKFDLSSYESQNDSVGQVLLRLFATRTGDCTLTASDLSDEWSESTVTWSDAPAIGNEISSTDITTSNKYYEWDITAYVKEQLEGDSIISCVIEDLGADNANIEFTSKEGSDNHPELVIITNGIVPEDTSTTSYTQHIHSLEHLLTVYPNPANEVINVSIAEGNIHNIEIYNLFGQKVYTGKELSNKLEISIDHLSSAIYLMKVESDLGVIVTRFIKSD